MQKTKGVKMGTCIYCGLPAGFFRSAHKECEQNFKNNQDKIKNIVHTALDERSNDFEVLVSQIGTVLMGVAKEWQNKILIGAIKSSIQKSLYDRHLDDFERNFLIKFINHYNFSNSPALNDYEDYKDLLKAMIINDIADGKFPSIEVKAIGNTTFNFQKGEKVIWIFADAQYFEIKTKTKYVGGSKGVSVRLAKGINYRVGKFQGNKVNYEEAGPKTSGSLIVTNKSIYFSGGLKNFRIPLNKIIAFEYYTDGFSVQKDTQSAKPQIFELGWQDTKFAQELFSNINNLES